MDDDKKEDGLRPYQREIIGTLTGRLNARDPEPQRIRPPGKLVMIVTHSAALQAQMAMAAANYSGIEARLIAQGYKHDGHDGYSLIADEAHYSKDHPHILAMDSLTELSEEVFRKAVSRRLPVAPSYLQKFAEPRPVIVGRPKHHRKNKSQRAARRRNRK